MLAIARLEELESRWHEMSAPVVAHLQPGLSDTAMDEFTGPLGLHLPVDARMWWGWHDGVRAETVRLHGDRTIVGAMWPYQPLAESVEQYLQFRAISDEFEARGEPRWFSPSWLPISSEYPEAVLLCECGADDAAATPIRRITPPEGQEPPAPVCASFDELVERWVTALHCGLWAREHDRWAYHPERLPAGWPTNGVA